jgi:hypothetical protein
LRLRHSLHRCEVCPQRKGKAALLRKRPHRPKPLHGIRGVSDINMEPKFSNVEGERWQRQPDGFEYYSYAFRITLNAPPLVFQRLLVREFTRVIKVKSSNDWQGQKFETAKCVSSIANASRYDGFPRLNEVS